MFEGSVVRQGKEKVIKQNEQAKNIYMADVSLKIYP